MSRHARLKLCFAHQGHFGMPKDVVARRAFEALVLFNDNSLKTKATCLRHVYFVNVDAETANVMNDVFQWLVKSTDIVSGSKSVFSSDSTALTESSDMKCNVSPDDNTSRPSAVENNDRDAGSTDDQRPSPSRPALVGDDGLRQRVSATHTSDTVSVADVSRNRRSDEQRETSNNTYMQLPQSAASRMSRNHEKTPTTDSLKSVNSIVTEKYPMVRGEDAHVDRKSSHLGLTESPESESNSKSRRDITRYEWCCSFIYCIRQLYKETKKGQRMFRTGKNNQLF
jgi:hypothetical protein